MHSSTFLRVVSKAKFYSPCLGFLLALTGCGGGGGTDGQNSSLPTTTQPPVTNVLPDVPSLGNWSGRGGNPANTAYVQATFDASKFKKRWASNFRETVPAQVASANGSIFTVTDFSQNIRAFDEVNGTQRWQANAPGVAFNVSPPAVAANKVFFNAAYPDGSGKLIAVDAANGALKIEMALTNVAELAAPLAIGDFVYTHGRTYVRKVSAVNGTKVWERALRLDPFQLAADADFIYAGDSGSIIVLRQSDGSTARGPFKVPNCSDFSISPVVGSQGVVYGLCGGVTNQRLFAFDTMGARLLWTAEDKFGPTFALQDATLYTTNGSKLEARSVADGKATWSMTVQFNGSTIASPERVVASNNLIFVAGAGTTVVIDQGTRKVVGGADYGGPLSISSKGVLYISGRGDGVTNKDANLLAYNLQ
jgi:outer membrane protein assembly factor BamB